MEELAGMIEKWTAGQQSERREKPRIRRLNTHVAQKVAFEGILDMWSRGQKIEKFRPSRMRAAKVATMIWTWMCLRKEAQVVQDREWAVPDSMEGVYIVARPGKQQIALARLI